MFHVLEAGPPRPPPPKFPPAASWMTKLSLHEFQDGGVRAFFQTYLGRWSKLTCAYSNGRKSSIRPIKLPSCQKIFWETSKAGPPTWLPNPKTCVCLLWKKDKYFFHYIIISQGFVWVFGCFVVVGDIFFSLSFCCCNHEKPKFVRWVTLNTPGHARTLFFVPFFAHSWKHRDCIRGVWLTKMNPQRRARTCFCWVWMFRS